MADNISIEMVEKDLANAREEWTVLMNGPRNEQFKVEREILSGRLRELKGKLNELRRARKKEGQANEGDVSMIGAQEEDEDYEEGEEEEEERERREEEEGKEIRKRDEYLGGFSNYANGRKEEERGHGYGGYGDYYGKDYDKQPRKVYGNEGNDEEGEERKRKRGRERKEESKWMHLNFEFNEEGINNRPDMLVVMMISEAIPMGPNAIWREKGSKATVVHKYVLVIAREKLMDFRKLLTKIGTRFGYLYRTDQILRVNQGLFSVKVNMKKRSGKKTTGGGEPGIKAGRKAKDERDERERARSERKGKKREKKVKEKNREEKEKDKDKNIIGSMEKEVRLRWERKGEAGQRLIFLFHFKQVGPLDLDKFDTQTVANGYPTPDLVNVTYNPAGGNKACIKKSYEITKRANRREKRKEEGKEKRENSERRVRERSQVTERRGKIEGREAMDTEWGKIERRNQPVIKKEKQGKTSRKGENQKARSFLTTGLDFFLNFRNFKAAKDLHMSPRIFFEKAKIPCQSKFRVSCPMLSVTSLKEAWVGLLTGSTLR